jgi:segregation and condensation protein B
MENLKSKIESLLFLSGRPMSSRELADLIKRETKEIEEAGDNLIASYKEKNSGLQIIKNGASWQMVTSPENAALAQEFVKDETTGELSRPSLETLTIIAYRGPIAKTDLDRIRGVNCSLILRNLLIRGLVEARVDKKSGESYYVITFDFLRFLGLNETKELPDYEKLSKDDTIDRILEDNPSCVPLSGTKEDKTEGKSVFAEVGSASNEAYSAVEVTEDETDDEEFEDEPAFAKATADEAEDDAEVDDEDEEEEDKE